MFYLQLLVVKVTSKEKGKLETEEKIYFLFREVSLDEGQKFAEEHKALFIEVSSKTGNNIAQIFQQVVSSLLGTVGPTQIQVPTSTEGREQPSSKNNLF